MDTPSPSVPFFPQSLVYSSAPHHTPCGALSPRFFRGPRHLAQQPVGARLASSALRFSSGRLLHPGQAAAIVPEILPPPLPHSLPLPAHATAQTCIAPRPPPFPCDCHPERSEGSAFRFPGPRQLRLEAAKRPPSNCLRSSRLRCPVGAGLAPPAPPLARIAIGKLATLR